MSHYGPFATRVGLYQRFTDFIDLIVRDSPDASAYRLWYAPTLNDAYGDLDAGSGVGGSGGTAILVSEANQISQTVPNAIRSAQTKVVENRQGQTSFQVDPKDIPVMDEQITYFRVQEFRRSTNSWLTVAGAINHDAPIQGPILVVPPMSVFGSAAGSYTLAGTAPSNTGCSAGVIPVIDTTVQTPLPMHLVLGKPASSILIRNNDTANALLVCYGPGMPMISVPKGGELVTNYGHGKPVISEILLACESGDAGCAFSIDVLTVHFII